MIGAHGSPPKAQIDCAGGRLETQICEAKGRQRNPAPGPHRGLLRPASSSLPLDEIARNRAGFKGGTLEVLRPFFGGAERDRTADLLVANEALSQLSYSPHRTGIELSRSGSPWESTQPHHSVQTTSLIVTDRIPASHWTETRFEENVIALALKLGYPQRKRRNATDSGVPSGWFRRLKS